jgi:hypothetical protein
MPILPEFSNAVYYLFKDGELLFRILPIELDRELIVKEWLFTEVGKEPKAL